MHICSEEIYQIWTLVQNLLPWAKALLLRLKL